MSLERDTKNYYSIIQGEQKMKINFASKTIEITKTFADKASHFGSEEYHALRTAMCDLPDFEVAIRVTDAQIAVQSRARNHARR